MESNTQSIQDIWQSLNDNKSTDSAIVIMGTIDLSMYDALRFLDSLHITKVLLISPPGYSSHFLLILDGGYRYGQILSIFNKGGAINIGIWDNDIGVLLKSPFAVYEELSKQKCKMLLRLGMI